MEDRKEQERQRKLQEDKVLTGSFLILPFLSLLIFSLFFLTLL